MPYIGNQPGTGVRSRFIYTATASQTTFSGADDNSKTLKYADSDYIDVYLNGVCLVPGTDYTASTKTSVVLTQAASLNDTLEVVAYDIATMADTVSKADGGTFEDGVTIRTADNTTQLTLESTDADANSGPVLELYRNSSSPADDDVLGEIEFHGENDADEKIQYGLIAAKLQDASDGTEDVRLSFKTITAGTERERVTIQPSEVVINEDSQDLDFRVESDGNANMFVVDGENGQVGIGRAPTSSYKLDLHEELSGNWLAHIHNSHATNGYGVKIRAGDDNNVSAFRVSSQDNNTTILECTGGGIVTKPNQPAFQAHPASQINNIGVGTNIEPSFDNERFDQNADYDGTNTFTAPVTGKYQFNCLIYLLNVDSASDYYELMIATSNKTYYIPVDPGGFAGDLTYYNLTGSVLADMDANDTCLIRFRQQSGTQQTDISAASNFSGYLVC